MNKYSKNSPSSQPIGAVSNLSAAQVSATGRRKITNPRILKLKADLPEIYQLFFLSESELKVLNACADLVESGQSNITGKEVYEKAKDYLPFRQNSISDILKGLSQEKESHRSNVEIPLLECVKDGAKYKAFQYKLSDKITIDDIRAVIVLRRVQISTTLNNSKSHNGSKSLTSANSNNKNGHYSHHSPIANSSANNAQGQLNSGDEKDKINQLENLVKSLFQEINELKKNAVNEQVIEPPTVNSGEISPEYQEFLEFRKFQRIKTGNS